jgi:hypothetical protein
VQLGKQSEERSKQARLIWKASCYGLTQLPWSRSRGGILLKNPQPSSQRGKPLRRGCAALALELCLLLRDKGAGPVPRSRAPLARSLVSRDQGHVRGSSGGPRGPRAGSRRAQAKRCLRPGGTPQPARARTPLRDTCGVGARGVELAHADRSRQRPTFFAPATRGGGAAATGRRYDAGASERTPALRLSLSSLAASWPGS